MLLVTDLDNTLYNWVEYYASVVRVAVQSLAVECGLSEETVVAHLRASNRRLGNSDRLNVFYRGSDWVEGDDRLRTMVPRLENVNRAIRDATEMALKPYEGVDSTLQALKIFQKARIVAHTEARANVARARLVQLGLWEWIDRLYAIDHRSDPVDGSDAEEGLVTFDERIVLVSQEERKPNPALLKDICLREGYSEGETWYVGDSLVRDIAMANHAGVASVWARYGTQYSADDWATLVSITHWTSDDVEREGRLRDVWAGANPAYTIDRFSELLPIVADGDALSTSWRRTGPSLPSPSGLSRG